MTDYLDNPAGRLAAILRAARNQSPTSKARACWSEVLDAPDDAALFARLGQLATLIDETWQAIHAMPQDSDPDFFVRPFLHICQLVPALMANVGHADMEAHLRHIPEEAVYGLEAASRELRRVIDRTPTIDEGGREELLVEVRALIDDVVDHEELSNQAKLYIVKLLRNVEAALIGYRLGGFDDVAAAVAAVSAGAVTLKDEGQRGWLIRAVGRLWQSMTSRAQGVQAIGNSVQSIAGAIESVDNLIG